MGNQQTLMCNSNCCFRIKTTEFEDQQDEGHQKGQYHRKSFSNPQWDKTPQLAKSGEFKAVTSCNGSNRGKTTAPNTRDPSIAITSSNINTQFMCFRDSSSEKEDLQVRIEFQNKIKKIRQYNQIKQNIKRRSGICKTNRSHKSGKTDVQSISKNSQGFIIIDNFESSQDMSSYRLNGTFGSLKLFCESDSVHSPNFIDGQKIDADSEKMISEIPEETDMGETTLSGVPSSRIETNFASFQQFTLPEFSKTARRYEIDVNASFSTRLQSKTIFEQNDGDGNSLNLSNIFSEQSLADLQIELQPHMGFVDIWSDIEIQWVNKLFVMEGQNITIYRNQETNPEISAQLVSNFEIQESLQNTLKIFTLIKEETGSPIFKIGVFGDEIYRKWMTAFVNLQRYNKHENSKQFDACGDIRKSQQKYSSQPQIKKQKIETQDILKNSTPVNSGLEAHDGNNLPQKRYVNVRMKTALGRRLQQKRQQQGMTKQIEQQSQMWVQSQSQFDF